MARLRLRLSYWCLRLARAFAPPALSDGLRIRQGTSYLLKRA